MWRLHNASCWGSPNCHNTFQKVVMTAAADAAWERKEMHGLSNRTMHLIVLQQQKHGKRRCTVPAGVLLRPAE